MKRLLFSLVIGLTSFTAFSNCIYAQHADNTIAFNNSKNFRLSIKSLAALESLAMMGTYSPDAKDINAKAIKDFQVRFKKVNNARWFSSSNGFVSFFVEDGHGNRAVYDKKGHWQFSLILYGENKLPPDIRTSIRSSFYDLAITQVEEIQTTDGIVYIVNLEGKSNIKVLKVTAEGEMDILMDLIKE